MPSRLTKNISLTPEHADFIEAGVESGRYKSASEVIRDALRLLSDKEARRQAALDEVRKKIAVGLEQAKRGELLDGEEVIKELLEELEPVTDDEALRSHTGS